MTANEYLDQFKDCLVFITKNDGSKICGFIRSISGGILGAGYLVPNSQFLEVETVKNVPAYLRTTGCFELGHTQIAENDIEKIERVKV